MWLLFLVIIQADVCIPRRIWGIEDSDGDERASDWLQGAPEGMFAIVCREYDVDDPYRLLVATNDGGTSRKYISFSAGRYSINRGGDSEDFADVRALIAHYSSTIIPALGTRLLAPLVLRPNQDMFAEWRQVSCHASALLCRHRRAVAHSKLLRT